MQRFLTSLLIITLPITPIIKTTGLTASNNINNVVFLDGSCRSGKSSICSEIQKHKNWQPVGSVYFQFSFETFQRQFPQAFSCITKNISKKNIRHALTKNMFIFKEGVTDTEKQLVTEAVKKIRNHYKDQSEYAKHKQAFSDYSLREIEKQLATKQNILADVNWYVNKQAILNITPKPKLYTALIYCPFDIALQRLVETNARALQNSNLINYRFFYELILSFFSLYELRNPQEGAPEEAIDTLNKSTFLSITEKLMPLLPNTKDPEFVPGFMLTEITKEEFEQYSRNIMAQFRTNKQLYIIPKKPYDIIIHSAHKTPHQCASEIVNFVTPSC